MGSQLRDALRCLCDEIGWSYAVFWRSIGFKSPMHLVWEDGHVTEYRVDVLVNKFMAQQVHVVGEGIVGRAATTGSHQWILAYNIHVSESGAKDLAELNTQFLAGIQTITVIPVLPHGVLQLGSTQLVMENIRFVNHVKNLLARLEWVTEALLSEMTLKALSQNSQSLIPQKFQFHGLCLSFLYEFSYVTVPVIASEMLPVKQAITTTLAPLVDASCSVIHGVCNPNLHLNSQPENRSGEVQGILCSPDMKLIQPAYSHDSTSKSQDQPSLLTSRFSSCTLPFPEQHLAMLSIKSLESAKGIGPDSDNSSAFPLIPHGPIFSNCLIDSSIHSFSGKSDTGDFANSLGRFKSLPDGTKKSSRVPYSNLSSKEAVQMLNQTSCSKSRKGLGVPFSNRLSINTYEPVTSAGSQKQEHDLSKACDVPSIESNGSGLCDQPHLSTLQDLSNSKTFQENQRNKSDICDANGINASQIKLNIKDNDESKFPHVFPVPSTSENDLYDILGPDYKTESFGGSFDDVLVNKNDASVHELVADDSSGMAQMDVCPISNPVNDDISGAGMFSIAGANQLLDAVVSNISYGAKKNSNDGGSCKTSMTNTCNPSIPVVSPRYQLIASSKQMQGKSYSLPPLLGKAEGPGSSSAKSSCSLGNKPEDCSQNAGIHKSQISLWVESGQSMHSGNLSGPHNRRVDEVGKPNRKRARPGENPRPRPKDRQMIMDRVKELREIVPNCAKCSIDALLEKTIKHVFFLQSVTKHADNLKGIGEPKFIDKEGALLLKDNFEGGVTWAFQVGSQSMTCPIIVEDLNPPRQMLVEMLCEQHGVFLEIADLIRGLGLTILKGVMEAHKDKIWARFAVEANRDVTRMEIFLSLVRLLESTIGCSAVHQGVGNINMPHNMYHQSCTAATGASNRLL